ncbi:MAG: hypothetical protein EBU90_05460 [Proteobacteria bacterium]|nr:hypothetical protein [Pseudomonadota bacterium]NBP13630.1 hypothetical protein [bacterium]
MAEPLPRPTIPFTKEFSPYEKTSEPVISSEDIRAKLHQINDYFDKNLPSVIDGISKYEEDKLNEAILAKKPSSFDHYAKLPEIQNELSGNILTGPRSAKNFLDLPTFDKVNQFASKARFEAETAKDPFKFAKPTSFNASIYGHNYDRYYSHPKFKQLGFDFRRDNESLYNANSTWFDDFRRMGSKLTSNIFLAGTDSAKNWGDWFSFSGNPNSAALMEHNMASGASSKEGVGAWITNFTGNLGYTLGTIGEIWVENALVAAAAGLTRNPTLMAFAGTNTALGLGKLAKSMSVMAKTLNNINKARQFRTAAWGAVKGAGQALNPFRELTSVGKQALNPNSAFNRLNGMAKASKSFGAFYRGLREINAVTAESRLEAAFVQNKVANESISAFYKKNGKLPEGADADAIVQRSKEAGAKTFIANVPVIYASNQLVLGTSLRGFRKAPRMISASNLKGTFFKTVRNFDWKKTGKSPMEVVANTGVFANTFKFLGNTVKKDFWKQVPSRMKGTWASKPFSQALGGGIRYLSANLAEGLQESYQEAVQSAVTDYYLTNYFSDLYKDPILASQNSWAASIHKGLSEQFSKQGFDTFVQGFLTGGVVGPVQTNIMKWFQKVDLRMKDYKNPGDREKFLEDEKKRLQAYADAVNSYTQDPILWSRWLSENAIQQRDFSERINLAEETGDRAAAETAKDDSMFMHVDTLLRTGKFNEFIDHLEGLKEMTDDELKDAFEQYNLQDTDENQKTYRERLDIAISKAKEIKGRIDHLNTIENPFNPDLFDPRVDTEAYLAEYLAHDTFEIAKRTIAFNEYTYKRTADRLESLLNKSVVSGPLGAANASDFTILFSSIGLSGETSNSKIYQFEQLLQTEIKALKAGTPEEKRLAEYKTKQLEKLRTLKSFIVDYRKARILINKAKAAAQDFTSAPKESQEAFDTLKKMATVLNNSSKNGQVDLNDPNISVDVIVETFMKNNLYDAYNEYVDVIAKSTDATKVKNTVDKSFNEFIDYLSLSSEHQLMGENMINLADPMAVYAMSSRLYNAAKLVSERSGELHKMGLEEYMTKIGAPDSLMKGLFDIGVYFDPDFIDDFLTGNVIPPYFINATNGSKIEIDDPKFNEIVDLIQKYALQTGKKFYNIPEKYTPPTPEQKSPPASNIPPEEEDDDEKGGGTEPVSVTSTLSLIPDDLRMQLIAAAKAKGIDPEDFLLNDPEAAVIIDNYNKTKSSAVDISTVTGTVTVDNPMSVTPEMIPGMEPLLQESASENWSVDPDDSRYYINEDKTKRVRRATSLLNKDFTESKRLTAYQNRGNALDELLRSFFKPEVVDGKITQIAFRDVILNMLQGKNAGVYTEAAIKNTIKNWVKNNLTEEYLQDEFRLKATEGFYKGIIDSLYIIAVKLQEYKIVSTMPTMFAEISTGELTGGTLDLLVEDKNGNLQIIDIKTYATTRDDAETRLSDRVQQNVYAEIIEKKTGRTVYKLNTIQIKIDLQSDNETLVSAKIIPNAKRGILKDVPKQNVKSILDNIGTAGESDEEKEGGSESTEPKVFLSPRFTGKLVYMTPGSGKTFVAKLAQKQGLKIVDSDDLLVDAVKALGLDLKALGIDEVNNFNVGNVIYELYQKGLSGGADSVYDAVFDKIQTLVKGGYTVLTGSIRFISKADVVVTAEEKALAAIQLGLKKKKDDSDVTSAVVNIASAEERVFEISPEKVEVLPKGKRASDILLSSEEKPEDVAFSETPSVVELKNAKSKDELFVRVKSYAMRNELFRYTNKDGSQRIYTPTEIAEIAKDKAKELNLDASALDYIDDILNLRKGPMTASEENDLQQNIEKATEETLDSSTINNIANNVANGKTDISEEDIDGLNNCENTPET